MADKLDRIKHQERRVVNNLILADAQLPDPHSAQAIGWFCIVAVCAIVGLRQLIGLSRDMKKSDGPEKRDVTITAGAVLKPEFDKHVEWDGKEHEKLWSKVGGVERGAADKLAAELKALREERHDDAQELQRKLDVFQKTIGALEKATELQNQALAQIQAGLGQRKTVGL
jgi:hypothetical protein